MHAGTACSHCMREGDSGFRFQNAERQRHAAVVAQGETGPQAVCGHPPCAAARKAVFRSAAFQPDGLDLAEGERPCKAGARRLEEGFLRGKIRRRAGGFVGAERVRDAPCKAQSLPLGRAEDSGRKSRAVGTAEALCHPGGAAEVAADAIDHNMPLSAKTALLICMIKSKKFKQNVQISPGKLEVLPQVVYNES